MQTEEVNPYGEVHSPAPVSTFQARQDLKGKCFYQTK